MKKFFLTFLFMPSLFCLSISTESVDNLVSEMKETQNPITQHSAQFKNLIMNPNTPSAELLKVKAGLDAKITTLKKMNTMLEELIKKQTPPEQVAPEKLSFSFVSRFMGTGFA